MKSGLLVNRTHERTAGLSSLTEYANSLRYVCVYMYQGMCVCT